jgi:hypothetical protein
MLVGRFADNFAFKRVNFGGGREGVGNCFPGGFVCTHYDIDAFGAFDSGDDYIICGIFKIRMNRRQSGVLCKSGTIGVIVL